MTDTMIKQMSKYEFYKESDVDWIGKIPKEWDVVRLGGLFRERRTKVSDLDFPALSVTKKGILPQLDSAAKTKDGDNRKLVKCGDFVINSRSDRKGSSGVSDRDGSVSLINIVLEPQKIEAAFSHHLLKSNAFIEEYYRVGRGIVADLWTTRYDEMRTISLALPSKTEQVVIAKFLDKKTSQIDEAIAIKQKQIDLLKERKQIIIQQVVTQGLNPNVPMKDSGVDWIGQIPEHWSVLSNRRILNSIEQGSSPAMQNNIEAGEYSVLKLSAIKFGEFQSHESKPITKKQYDPRYQISNGDFLVTRGNTLELVADSCVVYGLQCQKVMLSDLIYRLNFDLSRVDLGFLLAFFQSPLMREQIKKSARGSSSTMPKVSQEHIKSWLLLLPPIEEQALISNYLNLEFSKISKATELQQRQIDNLKEYKTTLINSAVTGKIKVTELA